MNERRDRGVAAMVAFLICLLAPSAAAAVPDGIDYQGYLTNSDGSAVDGGVTMTFAAYNVDIGGAPLWSESQAVAVEAGLFSVTLGTPVNPFPAGLFDGPVYVALTLAGEELLPRRMLSSAPYSFKADDAQTVGGATAAALDQSAHVADTGNPHMVTAAQTGAADVAEILALQAQLDGALADITTLQASLAAAIATINVLQADVAANEADIASFEFALAVVAGGVDALGDTVAVIETNTVLDLDGVLTLTGGDTARFTGVNVQIVNGTGSTAGAPNGKGNLLVGYNEFNTFFSPAICSLGEYSDQTSCVANGGVWAVEHKSGSHNVVVGERHRYSRYGGIVAGFANSITGEYAAVSGGRSNRATGTGTAVSGGWLNIASGVLASVSGGQGGTASGDTASIAGGALNTASGIAASVSGGGNNDANGNTAWASGGRFNSANGTYAAVSGGSGNVASALSSSITGGRFNSVIGEYSSVSGGGGNAASKGNVASGPYSSISGGVEGAASGDGSSVTGGLRNTATARWSAVSGGADRDSTGEADWRAGTLFENF